MSEKRKEPADAKYPKGRFLVVDKDGEGHLPVKDSDDGPLSHHLMGAAWAALHEGYRGEKYDGPGKAEAIAELKSIYKSEGMKTPDEQKSTSAPREVRSFRATSKVDGDKLVGHAAVFNSPSDDLGGWTEVLLPGCFDRAVSQGQDVRCLFNHDPNLILGRTKANTLSLNVDDSGLAYSVDLPNTTAGRDVKESVSRGDIDGCSFAFQCLDDEWKTEGGKMVRYVKALDLYDVSPVTFPAYPDTDVAVRAAVLSRGKQALSVQPGANSDDLGRRLRLIEIEAEL